jgi:hypothetical protein
MPKNNLPPIHTCSFIKSSDLFKRNSRAKKVVEENLDVSWGDADRTLVPISMILACVSDHADLSVFSLFNKRVDNIAENNDDGYELLVDLEH